jgi:hypothetical protein
MWQEYTKVVLFMTSGITIEQENLVVIFFAVGRIMIFIVSSTDLTTIVVPYASRL